MAQSLFEILQPAISKKNQASYVNLNINDSSLTPNQIVQAVPSEVGSRQMIPAINVNIIGLKEFVDNNVAAYSLPIASVSVLGGVKIGSGLSINAITGVLDAIGSGGIVTSISAGTGISVGGTPTIPIITNTAPDQTVVLNNGTGISVSGTYPNFTITNTSPSSGGTVTAVSIAANQGVTGSSSGGATPALTINLGALTGVTSLNGLVVTANTGVITTGTWQGTVIGTTYGGTGANNATNASGSFLRSNGTNGNYVASTLILPNTATANQIVYATSTNNYGGSANLTYDGTTLVQNAPTTANFTGAASSSYIIGTNATRNRLLLAQGDVTQFSALSFEVSATSGGANYMGVFKYGASASGTIVGTVANASLAGFNSGSVAGGGGTQPILFGGEPLYFGRYPTSTAVMMKLTKEGLTIDLASTMSNAASLNSLTVATGRSYFGGATAATSVLQVGGSFATAITSKTANYTLTISDYTVIFDGTSLTATLPAANTCAGRIYVLVNRNATTLTTSIAYETLTSGVTSTTVTAASSVGLQSNGTSWFRIF